VTSVDRRRTHHGSPLLRPQEPKSGKGGHRRRAHVAGSPRSIGLPQCATWAALHQALDIAIGRGQVDEHGGRVDVL
jgi:hypothetical protein